LTTIGGTSPFTYSWSPDTDLSCANCSAATLTGSGTDIKYYIVATDANGCKGIDSVLLISTPCVDMDPSLAPNYFSPNGDGSNDVFFIPGVCKSDSYIFRVYDRWGILMFESSMRKQWWDGRTTSGMEAKDGVYYYILETSTSTYKGYIQLNR
ncbi:MAG TPA: gliding motility-associated C-terminal domain-containing protein, partial [Bacteroidia bacterium]